MDLFFYAAFVDDSALPLIGAHNSRTCLSSIRSGVLVLPEAAEDPCSCSALQLQGSVLDEPSALACLSAPRYACQGFLATTAGECSPDESCFTACLLCCSHRKLQECEAYTEGHDVDALIGSSLDKTVVCVSSVLRKFFISITDIGLLRFALLCCQVFEFVLEVLC